MNTGSMDDLSRFAIHTATTRPWPIERAIAGYAASGVKGVTVWGYIVGATWETNTGIMKSDGTMRPAMSWLMDFLGR